MRTFANSSTQKLASKEYEKLTGIGAHNEDQDIDVLNNAEAGEASGDDDEGEKRKKKPQSLTRVLKSKLTKLVEKLDDRYAAKLLVINFLSRQIVGAYSPLTSWSLPTRNCTLSIIE